MKQAVEKYLQYMSSVKNSSPHTILNYGKDLRQFQEYLAPPGMQPPGLTEITHTIIREFVGHLHDQGLEKSFDCAKARGAALVLQVLRARRDAAGKSGAARAHAEIAEAASGGAVGGRDGWFLGPARGDGNAGNRKPCAFREAWPRNGGCLASGRAGESARGWIVPA